MSKKFVISISILLLSVFFTSSLSSFPILLSIILIIVAVVKRRIYPIKKELTWFILTGLGGAVTEIIIVNFSNAWNYSNTQLFGIPVWIPLFWGVVGTTIIVTYDGLSNV